MTESIIVTGGAGFIGSNFILQWLAQESTPVLNFDCLTYAGNAANLAAAYGNQRYEFVRGDINDRELVHKILCDHTPTAIVHFAAESHVDRSILGPDEFIRTNINGTFALITEANCTGRVSARPIRSGFAFCTCPLTKCTVRWERTTTRFARRRHTRRTVRMQPPKQLPITWYGRTFIPTACPRSRRTALITMAHSSFPRSSSRW